MNTTQVFRFFFLLVLSVPALAQSDDWEALNQTLANDVVVPAYQALADASAVLVAEANQLCAQPDEASLSSLQNAWHETMDAWQGIQHVKFGPVEYFDWKFRIQYWPDDKGTGGRQLDAMLAEQNRDLLDATTFGRESVGVQGLPALERLLFADDSQPLLQQESFRCEFVQAIANNISEIGAGVAQRWQDEFYLSVVLQDDSGYFEDLQDASTDFVKALVETVPAIKEQKLTSVLGESFEGKRERRAESWRSGRSLRNIKINMTALLNYYQGRETEASIKQVFAEEDALVVDDAFAEVMSLLEPMPDSLSEQVMDEAGYEQLKVLETAVDALYEALETAVKNTDLYLGFNSLDGD